ncbi:VWA domain-containing protein [Thiocystis violascens]|uniref:Tetratricopeptide repeat protein n=1 Tax=Thiocystis violascens (strain ATCC 17096 / DSM 198 / 6111) TaxID=765911 RepID=I3Y7E4_THIV6|nr:VWA domain-containing protein [Thiocystis violascens]AFL72912.1 tetratricopeptide repeat protein [Thiocystis violascens DSM 198]
MSFDAHFLRPLWLLAFLPLALLLLILWRQRQAGASVWRGLVDPHLLPHLLVGEEGQSRRWPLVLLGLGWSLAVLALAGPVWERLPQPLFSTASQRVILLDLSPSMNAADVPPSRLARARFELLDLLHASTEGQAALLAFGPETFVVAPLTGDARTIAAQVPQLTTDLIPVPGPRRTDLALEQAGEMLARAQGQGGDIVLITDGVGELAASLEVARRLQAAGHRLSVLAVGTTKGAPVPTGTGGFVQDTAGGIQIARLQSETLRELARAGKGRYLEAEVGDRDTLTLLAAGPERGERIAETALTADQWREEGPWLLLALLPLAALAFRRGWLLPALLLALMLPPRPGLAFGWPDLWSRPDQRAARQFAAGDAQSAADQFRDPAWRAAARYRSGDYAAALDDLAGLQDPEADYNRGNALARLGQFQEAVDAYEDALKQNPDQADARHNLELVRQLLEQQNPSDRQQNPSEQDQSNGEGGESSGEERNQGQDQGESGASDRENAQDGDQASEPGESDSRGDQDEGAASASNEATEPAGEQTASQRDEQGSDADAASGRDAGSPNDPDAGDFSPDALNAGTQPDESGPTGDDQAETASSTMTDPADRRPDGEPESSVSAIDSLTPQEREQQQAMEAQLRRVPDDPAGLLRQRFLLQHLRREGRLP